MAGKHWKQTVTDTPALLQVPADTYNDGQTSAAIKARSGEFFLGGSGVTADVGYPIDEGGFALNQLTAGEAASLYVVAATGQSVDLRGFAQGV